MSAPASARPAAPSYAAALRVPHARRAFATALVGRLSYGTVPLSLLLATRRATGSYAASGAVLSLHGAAVAFLTPPAPCWWTGTAPGATCCRCPSASP
ncbi:hypothetical protein E5082_03830 [Streptomyces griseoluteus]|uniref:MFS transporter n=1 Tax=Streptomyces griseoluteus TaxID=29306 RepID=A0A4Z1DQ93_STRGP|nr:hypothetical protein E5082_03830 [Streptomyces griseoluteus]GHF11952.1 hypothetical protein GCM10017776_32110 [Streptomyces griseoluteus]